MFYITVLLQKVDHLEAREKGIPLDNLPQMLLRVNNSQCYVPGLVTVSLKFEYNYMLSVILMSQHLLFCAL